ncbi:MAG: factor-independent urate hydroxylase [Planctomycetota bacterium]
MPHQLTSNSYGKSRVRMTKVIRNGSRHDLLEFAVEVSLEGAFDASYETGDNSAVVATDSIKNTVYVLAKEHDFTEPEAFAIILARHFVDTYDQVTDATVSIEQSNWTRIDDHDHAFTNGGSDTRTCTVVLSGDDETGGDPIVMGGVAGLLVLKTTASEFHTFVDDRYRTLADAHDRIFATTVDATWRIADHHVEFGTTYENAKRALLKVFAGHHSLAVQQTLLQMGRDVLDACPAIEEIGLEMPNQHRIPMNLDPFGLTNDNEIFMATDEPYGLITGTVTRGD